MLPTTIKTTLAATLLIGGSAFAQDNDGPIKYENAAFFTMTYIDFKPGKSERAFTIIREHFMKAGKTAGVAGPKALHFKTGGWDAAFIWKLENGPADLEWYRDAGDVKWMKALEKQEGGKEAAGKLMKEYQSLVGRTNTTFGHWHFDPDKKGKK